MQTYLSVLASVGIAIYCVNGIVSIINGLRVNKLLCENEDLLKATLNDIRSLTKFVKNFNEVVVEDKG